MTSSRRESRKTLRNQRHHAKVNEGQLPAHRLVLFSGEGCNEQVARVRVRVHKTIFEDLFQVGIQQPGGGAARSIPAAVIAA